MVGPILLSIFISRSDSNRYTQTDTRMTLRNLETEPPRDSWRKSTRFCTGCAVNPRHVLAQLEDSCLKSGPAKKGLGVAVDTRLCMSQLCAVTVNREDQYCATLSEAQLADQSFSHCLWDCSWILCLVSGRFSSRTIPRSWRGSSRLLSRRLVPRTLEKSS